MVASSVCCSLPVTVCQEIPVGDDLLFRSSVHGMLRHRVYRFTFEWTILRSILVSLESTSGERPLFLPLPVRPSFLFILANFIYLFSPRLQFRASYSKLRGIISNRFPSWPINREILWKFSTPINIEEYRRRLTKI